MKTIMKDSQIDSKTESSFLTMCRGKKFVSYASKISLLLECSELADFSVIFALCNQKPRIQPRITTVLISLG